MTTVIKTTNLTKKYKNVYALKDVSINIEKGEIYGIVGKNGAGKSTLLKLLSGITEPTKGSVELFQETNLMEQRKRMASIVENPTLFGELSAKDNLEYFRIQRGVTDKNTINETLRQVGLDPDDKKQVKKYSVGMKQRLALALSLLTNPEVLILDEPTNGIDPVGIVEIRHLLQALNEEKNVTIIISSHILSSLANIAT
ncbi:MAG: ATP-binding cassette domain-containing protein, partial [Tissierellia bacterium]|nr:ATP-binding cassette domain-containing protein [Tissierellia bacterium]